MPENTSPNGGGNLSPDSGFQFTTFGAVAQLGELLGATDARVITPKTVDIPPAVRKALSELRLWFQSQPNNRKWGANLPTEADAAKLRAQVAAFAEEEGLNVQFPKFRPAHWSRRDADPITGEYTVNGETKTAKWIDDSGPEDRTLNVGRQVTFRFSEPGSDDDEPTVDTTTVTVTQGAPRAPRQRSRGQQILAR